MELNGVEIEDTFAEAFDMQVARILMTADTAKWAQICAQSAAGFATSVIECKVEAGIDQIIPKTETPDKRPGITLLFAALKSKDLAKQLRKRTGQCILTCPTSAVFNALDDAEEWVDVGDQLRYFGDGYEDRKRVGDKLLLWRIPVIEGEFLIEEKFGIRKGVGGGNLILMGKTRKGTLKATEAAVEAIHGVDGCVAPFPGGICRSGSQVGSKYDFLKASTNVRLCPTLREQVPDSLVPPSVNSVLEIVLNGLSKNAVQDGMRAALHAAVKVPDLVRVTAANFGGKLGQHKLHLKAIID
ncbi:MAG: formylmethanofuran--tetrahydromethanopterin N-formyltransferase [Candidatus Odinarchaeota archaeon]